MKIHSTPPDKLQIDKDDIKTNVDLIQTLSKALNQLGKWEIWYNENFEGDINESKNKKETF